MLCSCHLVSGQPAIPQLHPPGPSDGGGWRLGWRRASCQQDPGVHREQGGSVYLHAHFLSWLPLLLRAPCGAGCVDGEGTPAYRPGQGSSGGDFALPGDIRQHLETCSTFTLGRGGIFLTLQLSDPLHPSPMEGHL